MNNELEAACTRQRHVREAEIPAPVSSQTMSISSPDIISAADGQAGQTARDEQLMRYEPNTSTSSGLSRSSMSNELELEVFAYGREGNG